MLIWRGVGKDPWAVQSFLNQATQGAGDRMWIASIPKRAAFPSRQEIDRPPFSLCRSERFPMQVLLQTLNGFFRIDLLERKGRFGLAFEKNDPAWFTEFGPTQAKRFDRVEPE